MIPLKQSTPSTSKTQAGFTLVELLIAIAMFSFVLLLVATTFIQINRAYTGGITTKRVHEETRLALNAITTDFRTASSGTQVSIYCGSEPGCENNPEVATRVLCFDQKAYLFRATTATQPGRLAFAEGVSCSEAASINLDSGTSQFGELLQVHFFRVSELVENRTYKIEMAVSAAYGSDLLQELATGEGIRDLSCNPSQQGSQFCRVIFLDSIVTLRSS